MSELTELKTGKRYYIYFSCAECGNEWHIEANDQVDVEMMGVTRITCLGCGVATDWIAHNITKDNMPVLYDK